MKIQLTMQSFWFMYGDVQVVLQAGLEYDDDGCGSKTPRREQCCMGVGGSYMNNGIEDIHYNWNIRRHILLHYKSNFNMGAGNFE